ncbi:MAG TPA: glycoside hydrolase family 9 protein [Candidatus Acidoferrales bacterium]|nr:glycoside hydrolase family 9 protein [Candidatus Acidoferrales bacterium]
MKYFKRLALFLIVAATGFSNLRAAPADAQIRVNQVGFLTGGAKSALLMATDMETNAIFQIVNTDGTIALTASIGERTGSWSAVYSNVYLLDFSAVKTAGVYSLRVEGAVRAVSLSFQIGTGKEIFGPLLCNSLFFFQAQRDGADVSSAIINRQSSHLTDRQAFVYKVPAFGKNGMQGGLKKTGGPVDVSGGWFDAGDYLKFVETASYVTALMLQTARDYPAQAGRGGAADFAAEGRHGLDWLLKMWNDDTKTLYAQVGLGDGNQSVTGDHDVWRLPEADDKLNVQPGDPQYFIKYRPVFPANSVGGKISPNLAGRLAAAFALGYQVFKDSDPAYAHKCLLTAEHIFDLAATTNITALTSAYPHDFYPEDEWRDDMEWGATELHLAHAWDKDFAPAAHYLQLASHWAHEYMASGNSDSLNLYDVSSLAHCELCRVLERSGITSQLEVTRDNLLAALKKQLDSAVKRAGKDSFGLGTRYNSGDCVPHILGLVIEAGFYDDLTHTAEYADFAQHQLDFVLGANAWGTSFIVGAGKVFPFHMQHQVANLAGSLDGTPPLVLGATVDGPARGKSSKGGDVPDGARATPWPGGKNPFAAFSGQGVQYNDDVGSYATSEPADDYTIPTVLIFARLASQ